MKHNSITAANRRLLYLPRLLLSLCDFVGLFCLLCLLGANSPELSVGPGLGDGVVGLEVLQLLCQLHGSRSLSVGLGGINLPLSWLAFLMSSSEASPFLGFLALMGKRISLAWYSLSLEPLGVQLEGLERLVAATVVDGDTDGASHVLADSSGLDFIKSESSSEPLLDVVGHLMTGLKVFKGLGATRAALAVRALRLRSLQAGWLNQVLIPILVEVQVRHHLVAFWPIKLFHRLFHV